MNTSVTGGMDAEEAMKGYFAAPAVPAQAEPENWRVIKKSSIPGVPDFCPKCRCSQTLSEYCQQCPCPCHPADRAAAQAEPTGAENALSPNSNEVQDEVG